MPLAPRWIGLALLAAPGLAAPPPYLTGRASVIDADTLEISGQRIRLAEVDVPESSQTCLDVNGNKWRCGQQAALALADLIAWHPVTCSISGQDRYDRQIGTCSAAGTEINQWLVRQGWAMAYRRYSRSYVADEQAAERAGRGIWQGQFVPPDQ
ncbi:thermonuclease family protein [Pseudophaeobacter sp.]|uniref:thermonuclease family protein n=1 Tax=Pseudophaeobacter sp. TaxID=1971739 RepID=UPI004058B2C2